MDLRMSKVSSETEAAIQAEVTKNRNKITKEVLSSPVDLQIVHWTEDLVEEVENGLITDNNQYEDESACDDYAEEASVGMVEETPRAEFSIVVP